MRQEDIWDVEAAEAYDTPGEGMFAPEAVVPAVDRLAALADGGRALEFAVGTGRLAVPLDEETLPVVVGDMATTVVPGGFTLVYLVYNTISNLLTQAEQVECFRNAARHLGPGGRFVIELEVPDLRRLVPGQEAVVFRSETGYLGVDTYDIVRQHLVSHHFRFGEGRESRLFRSPHRYVWPAELDLMARIAGFDLESRTATWTGDPFTAESTSHVSVYRLGGPV